MDGYGQTLYWFPNDKVKVEVPFFQRPYVWDEEDWDELIASINSANKDSMPFIGSLILQKMEDRFYVIDGQQRITTLSVMIKAFIDTFLEIPSAVKSQFESFIYDITYHGFSAMYETRLIPSNIDKKDFDAVMMSDTSDISEKCGPIINAYKYFTKYFKNNTKEQNTEFGSKILTRNKFFISIILDAEDDEQKIFDSVNSLGKDLTNADIIKNYLFQKMKDFISDNPILLKNILELHQNYWADVFYSEEKRVFWETKKTLGRIQTNNLEAFLKDYATIKQIYSPSNTGGIDGLAKSYKLYINTLTYEELVVFLKDLSDYAVCYYSYNNEYNNLGDFKMSDVLNTTLLILDKLETTTFNPYILKLVKSNSTDKESKLSALQRFVFTRFIYKAKTKNYNKVCENLLTSDDELRYLQSYSDSEPIGLDEFPVGLKRITNKQATLVLFILEMIRRNGEENKYSDNLKYPLSLEHIMPQKWEKHWSVIKSYKPINDTLDFEEVTDYSELIDNRKRAIYSIGNMTLLTSSLNSSIGNASFSEKTLGNGKDGGYKKYSGNLTVAKEIIDTYEAKKLWDERDIYTRTSAIFSELNAYYKFCE